MDLDGMSSAELLTLAREAKELASALQAKEPSYKLALAAGVRDVSYDTVRWGRVRSYEGTAVVTMDDGSRWKCRGHGPEGTAEVVFRQGWIEFTPLKDSA